MVDLNQNNQESTETGNQETSTETENQGTSTETENQENGSQANEGSETEDHQINQEAVNKKIGKLTAKRREAEAKAEETRKELETLKAKLAEKEKTASEITIPPLPDAYDPEYEAKVKERDRLLQEKAKAQATADMEKKRQEEIAIRQQENARQKYVEQSNKMYAAGEKVGIKKEELMKAEQTLSLFIKDPGIAQFILAHEDSALIVNHLANNVEELDNISSMPGVAAGVHIATKILPEARKLKTSVGNTPDPLDIPNGKVAGATSDSYLKGVTFE